jgi:MFS family permease
LGTRLGKGISDRLAGYARTGQDGAKATARYYASSGTEERSLVKASFYIGATAAVLWYVLFLYWGSVGFSSQEIGIMEAAGTIAGTMAYLVGGFLADKMGRRLLFLVGLVSTAIGLIMFLGERSLPLYTAAYSLTNIGGSITWPCLTALMADKASPVDMKFFFAVQGFVNQVGSTIAGFLGIFVPAFLADHYGIDIVSGYRFVFLVAAAISIIPIIYVLSVTEVERKPEPLVVHYDRRMRRVLGVYSLQNAIIGVGAAFVIPWFPLIFQKGMGASVTQVSLMVTLSGAILAFGWFVVPKFAEARGSVRLISISQLASVVPMILIPYSAFSLLLVAALYTTRNFLMLVPTPVLNAYMVNIVSIRIRASFLSLGQVSWQIGFAVSSVLAGILWSNDYSKKEPFYIAVTLYIVATLIFWWYFKGISDPGDILPSKTK